ncbi:hypothetical protein EPA93_01880 [Ktedonosporobacter rubrisoli]|uniref:Uncharacterized protein n=1 Tax=Ktedonosporobacter rubrisoli TaxID=2509675 RepID=A0A4P6JIC3_KTERU|nr:hypothetical protein [Ktedonosporobacter rubrisoli]QBD74809.1 hypothetical protein EPA93_01880 [Ktedonosporobacter rubrisoli]
MGKSPSQTLREYLPLIVIALSWLVRLSCSGRDACPHSGTVSGQITIQAGQEQKIPLLSLAIKLGHKDQVYK